MSTEINYKAGSSISCIPFCWFTGFSTVSAKWTNVNPLAKIFPRSHHGMSKKMGSGSTINSVSSSPIFSKLIQKSPKIPIYPNSYTHINTHHIPSTSHPSTFRLRALQDRWNILRQLAEEIELLAATASMAECCRIIIGYH